MYRGEKTRRGSGNKKPKASRSEKKPGQPKHVYPTAAVQPYRGYDDQSNRYLIGGCLCAWFMQAALSIFFIQDTSHSFGNAAKSQEKMAMSLSL